MSNSLTRISQCLIAVWFGILTSVFSQGSFAEAATPPPGPSTLEMMMPMLVVFAIFFLLVIRPQQRRAADHQNMIQSLKKGDEVITTGGIFGRIEGLTEKFVTLAVAEGVRLRVLRQHVAGYAQPEGKS